MQILSSYRIDKSTRPLILLFLYFVDVTIKTLDFDVFAIGEDQNHEGFQRAIKWCEDNGKEVVRMKRTPGICSSEIKKML